MIDFTVSMVEQKLGDMQSDLKQVRSDMSKMTYRSSPVYFNLSVGYVMLICMFYSIIIIVVFQLM